MDPQETKDERRAIYFGPLFPRRSAVARLRACERAPRLKTGARGWSGVQRGGRGLVDDELPTSRDGCREPHAIKAKRYETLRGSSSTVEPYIAFLQSRGSIVPFAEDNELASFNTMARYLQHRHHEYRRCVVIMLIKIIINYIYIKCRLPWRNLSRTYTLWNFHLRFTFLF